MHERRVTFLAGAGQHGEGGVEIAEAGVPERAMVRRHVALLGELIQLTQDVRGPIAIALARLIWRRTSEPRSASSSKVDDTAVRRLAELQQSMDAMAVEIERIAEGQRFVTKLMSERPAPLKEIRDRT